MSSPEAPEIKKTFLIQLAWSDMLNTQELNELLSKYEEELQVQLVMQQEKDRRALHWPNRSTRERFIWERISENIISTYNNELNWVRETRQKLFENLDIKEKDKMNYQIIEMNNKKYIELISATNPLSTENDALDLVALTGEHDTYLLMIHYAALSKDFFKLKTRVAGDMLQKFINYGVKTVAVIPQEIMEKGRFREMALETNKGNHFRMYGSKEEAEEWLLR
ncbi:DUF4180 domain-containing protein [Clostridium sp. CX1]|nr:DUF4180 domain-containing protein [Clostridium sp. CX1]